MTFHDDELAAALEMPGLSPAEADRLRAAADRLNKQEASNALHGAQQARDSAARRCSDFLAEADDLDSKVRDIRASLGRREITAKQAAKEIAGARDRSRQLAVRAVGLLSEVAGQDAIFSDPNAYTDRIYETYPTLAATRPSIFD